jgi:molecular chaperone DnaK
MILKKENIDLSSDIQALQRLTEAAEKQRSNYQLLTTIHLPFITADKTGPKHIEKELTRDVLKNYVKN